MIDIIGTEKYLAKLNGTRMIGFSATIWFKPGSVYITSAYQIQMLDAFRLSKEVVSERNLR